MKQETLVPAAAPARRRILAAPGALAGAAALAGLPGGVAAQGAPLFTLGVASGDPDAFSVVLWTRLAPAPLEGGGMPQRPVLVFWEVAADPQMRRVVRRGVAIARPEDGHSVNVAAWGLAPDREYWYRFHASGQSSRIGRTRTFPLRHATPERLRFALVSCQDYQAGFFAAYRDIAAQKLDCVVHVGDYIYEYAADGRSRSHIGPETETLEQYRQRYAQYRLDPDLQDAHASCPFICTWDDHEVENNYADGVPEATSAQAGDPAAFSARRAAAYRAYREAMPIRRRFQPDGEDFRIFRRIHFGRLAQFNVLDTRQYRTDQPCGDGFAIVQACAPGTPTPDDPDAVMLGETQEQWLYRGLRRSESIWNVLAQQVMFMQWDLGALSALLTGTPGLTIYNADAWDGYRQARQRILDFFVRESVRNPIVLTGDIHSSWAADLKQDFRDPVARPIGAEFVCTSISSEFGDQNAALVSATLASNPHIRFFDGLFRGYVLCEVTPARWRTDFRAVERIANPEGLTVPTRVAAVNTLRSVIVEADAPGIRTV